MHLCQSDQISFLPDLIRKHNRLTRIDPNPIWSDFTRPELTWIDLNLIQIVSNSNSTRSKLNLIFLPDLIRIIFDQIRSGYMFGLSSDEFLSKPKPDQVDLNPILPSLSFNTIYHNTTQT